MRKSMVAMLAVTALVAAGCLIWTTTDVRGQAGGGGGGQPGGGFGGQPGGGGFGGRAGPGQPGGDKKGKGFGGGGAGSNVFGAMAPPKLTPWEYRVHTRNALAELGKDNFEAGLNAVGADGWELIGIETNKANAHTYIFRRLGTTKPRADAKPVAEFAPKEKAEEKPVFRIFRLKHARADEVAQLLSQLFGRSPSQLRIVADAHGNQLLLRGSAAAHIEIEEILHLIDVPGDAPPPSGPGPRKKGGPGFGGN